MTTKKILSAAATTILSGTLMLAANVKTDYDHSTNFENYKTYSWGQVNTANPLDQDRVKAEVDRELSADGWKLVPTGGQSTVFATTHVKNEKELTTMYDGLGGGWGGGRFGRRFGGGFGGFGESTTTEQNQPVDHLVLDIFSSADHHLLFRGISDHDLSNNADKNTKNLDKEVDSILKKLPAGARS